MVHEGAETAVKETIDEVVSDHLQEVGTFNVAMDILTEAVQEYADDMVGELLALPFSF